MPDIIRNGGVGERLKPAVLKFARRSRLLNKSLTYDTYQYTDLAHFGRSWQRASSAVLSTLSSSPTWSTAKVSQLRSASFAPGTTSRATKTSSTRKSPKFSQNAALATSPNSYAAATPGASKPVYPERRSAMQRTSCTDITLCIRPAYPHTSESSSTNKSPAPRSCWKPGYFV